MLALLLRARDTLAAVAHAQRAYKDSAAVDGCFRNLLYCIKKAGRRSNLRPAIFFGKTKYYLTLRSSSLYLLPNEL